MSEERIFLGILIANTFVAVFYLVWGLVLRPWIGKQRQEKNRFEYIVRSVVIFLCPIVGIVFFAVGFLLYRTVFRREIDLADVIFSKERVRQQVRADEERERNIAPLEEAIAVSDSQSLRGLMLSVIRGDVQNSLAAIALALNSQDSESAHYAASVLQDELNNFRGKVQELFSEIEKEEKGKTYCENYLIPYMNAVLEQKVFTNMEQQHMVEVLERTAEILYQKAPHEMTAQYFEWVSLRLLDVKDFEKMEKWCDRAFVQYPDELTTFTCKLKLYFTSHQKEKFFDTLDALKQSSIVIDKETLELIRTFS